MSDVSDVPPVRVSPVNAPAPTQTPDSPQTVSLGQSALVVQAVVDVQMPAAQVGAPLGHCPLFVQVKELKVAGVAIHEADVPVAVKFPLLSANALVAAHVMTSAAAAHIDANFFMISPFSISFSFSFFLLSLASCCFLFCRVRSPFCCRGEITPGRDTSPY